MNAVPDRLWYLLSLRLAGEATQEELSELEGLLQANPGAVFQTELMQKLWSPPEEIPGAKVEEAYSRHLQRLSNHLAQPVLQYEDPVEVIERESAPVRSLHSWWWAGGIAASVLLGVWLFFASGENKKDKAAQNVVSTRHGSKSKVELPDGTVVWLNSGSRLTYDEAFNGSLREVRLEGEAFFEVAKDKSRPFIIHTQTLDVRVLGTAFNLRAYPDEATTETALIHGSVEVKVLNNPDKKIVLKPSEKLVVQNKQEYKAPASTGSNRQSEPLISISRVHPLSQDSTLYETSWVANRLAFDNETLGNIALRLERWYDVDVIISDETLKQTTYTADFEGESLDEVMSALQISGGFSYSIHRKEVHIKP